MCGLIISTASFATSVLSEPKKSAIETRLFARQTGKVELFISKENGFASIELKNEMGNIIYEGKLNLQKGLAQTFDVSSLGAGSYEFLISVGKEKITKTFNVEAYPYARTIKII